MNDLHTAGLTVELASATGAAALVNGALDRNLVDLNRVSAACAHAPAFLEQLATLLGKTLARHGRAVLLTVHGWNVVQPVLDLGLGGSDAEAAVSPAFAASAIPALRAACAAAGIGATVGARYPARGRENLLQLFTPRYREDPRPAVRALAALAGRVEAVQLELGIPLRWPGPWRARLVAALVRALPALAGTPGDAFAPLDAPAAVARPSATLEFVAGETAGAAQLDAGGGRLLLLPSRGGLLLFTGETAAARRPGEEGALEVEATDTGGMYVRYRGPLLRFPDLTPFLDLELGLTRAALVDGEVELALAGGTGFGRVAGHVRVDGTPTPLAGHGFAGHAHTTGPRWLRLALRLDDRTGLTLTVPPGGGPAAGRLHRNGDVVAIEHARVRLGGAPSAPFADLEIAVTLAGAEHLHLRATAAREVPVVRRRAHPPLRIVLATLRLADEGTPVGWAELAQPLPFSA